MRLFLAFNMILRHLLKIFDAPLFESEGDKNKICDNKKLKQNNWYLDHSLYALFTLF